MNLDTLAGCLVEASLAELGSSIEDFDSKSEVWIVIRDPLGDLWCPLDKAARRVESLIDLGMNETSGEVRSQAKEEVYDEIIAQLTKMRDRHALTEE